MIDIIRQAGWPSVRGNADEFLVRIADGATPTEAARPGGPWHGPLPAWKADRAMWAVRQLSTE